MRPLQIIRDWALVLAIIAGIAGYFIYSSIPALNFTRPFVLEAVAWLQPLLIFAMLFLSMVRISVHDLRPCRWHGWLLLIQAGLFMGITGLLLLVSSNGLRTVLEGAMICLICPTATAAAVVTRKLGGDMGAVVSYTVLINLVAAVLIPISAPLLHPMPGMTMLSSMAMILGKVMPLLLLPMALALIVRKLMPAFKRALDRVPDLAFYLWMVALALAIAMTVRSIAHSEVSISTQIWLVAASLAACAFQFWAGRRIGRHYGDATTAGQALGQKNIVFAIWISYTFFSPVSAVAGGFYSIWHNVVNTWQLMRHRKEA